MSSNSRAIRVLFGAAVAVFLLGLLRLATPGFGAGDVHPPYSSFRADPMGLRALYGALDTLPGVHVRRNLEPITQLGGGQDTTLILCGATMSDDPRDAVGAIETFVGDGGRLVVTFFPMAYDPLRPRGKDGDAKDDPPDADDAKPRPPWYDNQVSIEDRWGFSYAYAKLPGATESSLGAGSAVNGACLQDTGGTTGDLPGSVSWHTTLYFDACDDAWSTVYALDDKPVIVERPWARGTIVLCSDSYLLSNEAMRDEQSPELLAWLVGPSTNVVFDETHLGIIEQPGVMTLIRKYRLPGLLGALILVALLYVWKNAASLVPKHEAAVTALAGATRGRDSSAGLVNVLRRSIRPRNVVAVCVEEWQRSLAHVTEGAQDKRASVRAVADKHEALTARQRDPVEAYQAICAALAESGTRVSIADKRR